MTAEATLDTAALDQAVADLHAGAQSWVALPLADKVRMLDALRPKILAEAPGMVAVAAEHKGIAPDSTWVAEDWLTGPWAFLQGVNALLEVLNRVVRGEAPIKPAAVHSRPDGQTVIDVFPVTTYDQLLFNGYHAEVWVQPGVTPEQAQADAAKMYRGAGYAHPGVALVLGAGNVGTITTLDILHMLYTEGSVTVVKMNPVNDYLGPFYERIFSDFVSHGWLRFVYGGAEVGGYLAHHAGIDSVHMTGSSVTHDAIVWGVGAEAEERRANNTPLLTKPMSSELGGISPFIVVPGEWTPADLRFQAEHLVTSKLNNAGHNCIATQVVVLAHEWPQANQFLAEVRKVLAEVEPRDPYYPRSAEKTDLCVGATSNAEFLSRGKSRVLLPEVQPDSHDSVLTDEVFAGVMGVVRLPGKSVEEFLTNAVDFANDTLPGTLGASLIIDPKTRKEHTAAFDAALAGLRYGSIGVNAWTGLNFLLGYTPWGGFPGHTLQDIGSGIGFVHNAFLLQDVQKGVTYMPFRPSLTQEFTLSPKPPFFVTNKTAGVTAPRLVNFLATGKTSAIPGIFASALRG
jgi:hypothetical protein